jgi:hypothetical protein
MVSVHQPRASYPESDIDLPDFGFWLFPQGSYLVDVVLRYFHERGVRAFVPLDATFELDAHR